MVIKDYTEFIRIIRWYEKQLSLINNENNELKSKIRQLQAELEATSNEGENTSNIDLIRRISQLEKIVYSKLK